MTITPTILYDNKTKQHLNSISASDEDKIYFSLNKRLNQKQALNHSTKNSTVLTINRKRLIKIQSFSKRNIKGAVQMNEFLVVPFHVAVSNCQTNSHMEKCWLRMLPCIFY